MAWREATTRDAGLLVTAGRKYGMAQPRCGRRGSRRRRNQLRRDARTRQRRRRRSCWCKLQRSFKDKRFGKSSHGPWSSGGGVVRGSGTYLLK